MFIASSQLEDVQISQARTSTLNRVYENELRHLKLIAVCELAVRNGVIFHEPWSFLKIRRNRRMRSLK